MLPAGTTPAMMGGPPPPTYGVDQYTTCLMKFDGQWGLKPPTAKALTDYVKPSRVWTPIGANTQTALNKFAGTGIYVEGVNGGYVYCPTTNDPDFTFTGDFTIEFYAWGDPTATVSGVILAKNQSGTNSPWLFYQQSGTIAFYASSDGVNWNIASAQPIGAIAGAWNHYAVTRKGSTWDTWFNGVKAAEWVSATAMLASTNSPIIGTYYGAVAPLSSVIYIDELRFSNIARYTANFTPQTSPFYGALDGGNDAATKLLMHFFNNWNDVAKGTTIAPHVFTATGTAVISSAQSKFGGTSAYFNGATNCGVTTPGLTSIDLQFYNSDFTIDFWYYRIGVAGAGVFLGARVSNGTYGSWLIADSGTNFVFYAYDGSTWNPNNINIGTIPSSQWVHFALVRDSTAQTLKSYINGALAATYTAFTTVFATTTYGFCVGGPTDAGSANFYMNELRISDVVRWKAPFTPPTLPYGISSDAYATKLLMHFDGATNLADSSVFTRGSATNAGAIAVVAGSKFGDGCASFSGAATAYMTYPDNPDFNFGSADFTVDFWVRLAALGVQYGFFGKNNNALTNGYGCYVNTSGTLQFYWLPSDAGFASVQSAPLILDTNWHHIALVRNGTSLRLYCDGVDAADGTISAGASITTNASPLTIGRLGDLGAICLNGYLDELRICKGIARWTTNFTPPTQPYS